LQSKRFSAIASKFCFLTYIDKVNRKQVLLHTYPIFLFLHCAMHQQKARVKLAACLKAV